jgi:SAM-dependent methyltransferase
MRSKIFPDEYDEHDGVLFPSAGREAQNRSELDDVEGKISEVVSSSTDVSSLSLGLRSRIDDPTTLYQFSPKRSNLLRPLSALLKGRILEIGAGFGSITRFLGESGAGVIAVEESPSRASVARQRTRDLPNVRIVSDDINSMSFHEKFDVITLVGAVGYRDPRGISPELLKTIGELLDDRGTLIVAVENKLGLKYFAGAKEDQWPAPFTGINDQSDGFGRGELQRILRDAGFGHCDWFYPFPDFKLPTTILSEAAFQNPGAYDLSPLFVGSNFDDPKGARPGTFALDRAWGVVARNGLTEDLANSFLIACRRSEDTRAPATTPNAIAWHYSVDRHPAFAKQAVFERGAGGDLVVKRARLSDAPSPDVPLKLVLDDEDFVPGRIWSAELSRLMNRPGWTSQEVADWLRFWIDAVLAKAGYEPGADPQTTEIPGILLDAMPFNMVLDPAGPARFIDLEWESQTRLTMLQLSYRAMSKTLTRLTSCAAPLDRRNVAFVLLIKDVLRRVGINVRISDMRRLEGEDRTLQYMVRNGAMGGDVPGIARFYLRTLKVRSEGRGGLGGSARKLLSTLRK